MTLATTSDNAAHGYNLTFAFPMILFIVIAASLYLLYRRPHKVPGHGELRLSPASQATPAGGAVDPGRVPEPDAARAAAVASGLTTAPGGGAMESVHEGAGAHRAAIADDGSGSLAQDENEATAAGPESGRPSAADSPPTEDEG